jgi:hypothetical protein
MHEYLTRQDLQVQHLQSYERRLQLLVRNETFVLQLEEGAKGMAPISHTTNRLKKGLMAATTSAAVLSSSLGMISTRFTLPIATHIHTAI